MVVTHHFIKYLHWFVFKILLFEKTFAIDRIADREKMVKTRSSERHWNEKKLVDLSLSALSINWNALSGLQTDFVTMCTWFSKSSNCWPIESVKISFRWKWMSCRTQIPCIVSRNENAAAKWTLVVLSNTNATSSLRCYRKQTIRYLSSPQIEVHSRFNLNIFKKYINLF